MSASEGSSPSGRSYLSIREVLDLLVGDFPDVAISKIRYLESRGLIHPERTPSGYRKFYETDVERLRWILSQQREHFLPLKVIKGRLEQVLGVPEDPPRVPSLFDEHQGEERDDALVGVAAGHRMTATGISEQPHGASRAVGNGSPGPVPTSTARVLPAVGVPQQVRGDLDRLSKSMAPTPRPPALPNDPSPEPVAQAKQPQHPPTASATPGTASPGSGDKNPAPASTRRAGRTVPNASETSMAANELAQATGVTPDFVLELEEFGLIVGRDIAGVRCFDEDALVVARLAGMFGRFGIEPRHLKTFKHAAERETGLFGQVVTPLLLQRNPDARQRAMAELAELAELGASLQDAFVKAELRKLTGG